MISSFVFSGGMLAGAFLTTALLAQTPVPGHVLDRPLRVGDRINPDREIKAPPTPLNDGLGGQRLDDRWIRDGLRFAPEFVRGNSIYHRSLLFDYYAYRGWDLVIKKAPQVEVPSPRPAPTPSSPTANGRVGTRIDTRIDTRADARATPRMQPVSRSSTESATPRKIEVDGRASLKSLEVKQIQNILEKEVSRRLLVAAYEKKTFGKFEDRKLSREFLERNHVIEPLPPLSLLGLKADVLLRMEMEKLSFKDFIAELELFRSTTRSEIADEWLKKLVVT
jgi:hypothetical protein